MVFKRLQQHLFILIWINGMPKWTSLLPLQLNVFPKQLYLKLSKFLLCKFPLIWISSEISQLTVRTKVLHYWFLFFLHLPRSSFWKMMLQFLRLLLTREQWNVWLNVKFLISQSLFRPTVKTMISRILLTLCLVGVNLLQHFQIFC